MQEKQTAAKATKQRNRYDEDEIDKLIEEKKPTGAALQEAIFMKSSILFQPDKAKAKEMLLEAKELAPQSETGKRIDGILERFFKDE